MKLSVLTVTCRKDPRFAEMARALFWSFRRAPADTELEWIIVDDLLWSEDPSTRSRPITDVIDSLPIELQQRLHVEHFPPTPTEHRGPDVSDPLPAHNSAANDGLAAIALDSRYVCYLADGSCVTAEWVAVALELAVKNLGWKCRTSALHDAIIPKDGPLRHQDSWDNLRLVAPTTVAGPCWARPVRRFSPAAASTSTTTARTTCTPTSSCSGWPGSGSRSSLPSAPASSGCSRPSTSPTSPRERRPFVPSATRSTTSTSARTVIASSPARTPRRPPVRALAEAPPTVRPVPFLLRVRLAWRAFRRKRRPGLRGLSYRRRDLHRRCLRLSLLESSQPRSLLLPPP